MQNKIHRLVITLVLVLLGLASLPYAGSAATGHSSLSGSLLHLRQATDTGGDPVQGEPDSPNINKRLREAGPSDDSGARGFAGTRVFNGYGRVWASWFLSRWIAR